MLGIYLCRMSLVLTSWVTYLQSVSLLHRMEECGTRGGNPVCDIEIAAPSAVSMANFKSVLEKGSDVDEPRFMFRILKGHNIDNLLKQRAGSVQAYLGFAGIGALTVAYGEELIRDSVEVTYLL